MVKKDKIKSLNWIKNLSIILFTACIIIFIIWLLFHSSEYNFEKNLFLQLISVIILIIIIGIPWIFSLYYTKIKKKELISIDNLDSIEKENLKNYINNLKKSEKNLKISGVKFKNYLFFLSISIITIYILALILNDFIFSYEIQIIINIIVISLCIIIIFFGIIYAKYFWKIYLNMKKGDK